MDSFSAAGFVVQIPDGPRKSGMPESVEIPAPVSAARRVISPFWPDAAIAGNAPEDTDSEPGRASRTGPASDT